jgi:hypothetical protein
MRRLLWALALLFVADFALPMSPGAFQFEGQSVEVARRLTVEAATVVPMPSLQPRSSETRTTEPAPRISLARRAAAPRPFAVPFVRSPQVEADASSAVEDPA